MRCWKCKQEMPEGLKYCGNCGVHMNRAVHTLQWLFSKKGLPVLIVLAALLLGAAAWYIIPRLRPPVVEFDPYMGWYTPEEGDIVYEDDSRSYGYVSNMILVFFTRDATDETIAEIVDSVDGEVVGILPGVRQYQIRVESRSSEELEQLRKELMQFDAVKNAIIDYVATVDNDAVIPTDDWDGATAADWNEANPGGSNWWLEAAHILSAWEYSDHFSHMNVGVADGGFDLSHEDLTITVLNEELNNYDDHGTHVAGIIGATHNNGLGISGVLSDVSLYGVDCFATEEQTARSITLSSFIGGVDRCLVSGCRVVNLSAGLNFEYATKNPKRVVATARDCAEYLIMMLDAYDTDFLIVKSAGNAAADSLGYNGYFASMNEALVQEVLEDMLADGVKLEKDISARDVMDTILVVGAVDDKFPDGSYRLASFSNFGSSVTICAPGSRILSTVPTGNGYDYYYGTSMAAPIVTGVAAMVWSTDPAMTVAQVKEILLSTATEPVLPVTPGDTGSYYMVNAAAAVEMALNIQAEQPTEEPTEAPTEAPTEPPVTEPVVIEDYGIFPAEHYFIADYNPAVDDYSRNGRFLYVEGGIVAQYPCTYACWHFDRSLEGRVEEYLALLQTPPFFFEVAGTASVSEGGSNDGEYYFFRYTGSRDVAALPTSPHAAEGLVYHLEIRVSLTEEEKIEVALFYGNGLESVTTAEYRDILDGKGYKRHSD